MDFANNLKKRGYRITNAREVICSILENSGHKHFSVEELHNEALKKDKSIDLATVYRTLEVLEDIDIIEHSHHCLLYTSDAADEEEELLIQIIF